MMRLHEDDPLARAESYLRTQPLATHAYALGYLGHAYRGFTQAVAYPDHEPTRALALSYHGLARPALFLVGDPDDVGALLRASAHQLPSPATLHIPPSLADVVAGTYLPLTTLHPMHRMVLHRDTFENPPDDPHVERLSASDTEAVLSLYAFWPDHLFEPWNLRTGIYYGIRAPDGSLAAIAGTHNVSEEFDIAAIGNLVTHPDHRQKGFARRCNAQLLRTVFQAVKFVTLDVREGNLAAVRTYQSFGFQHQADFLQGAVVRP